VDGCRADAAVAMARDAGSSGVQASTAIAIRLRLRRECVQGTVVVWITALITGLKDYQESP
jgi:hypothetical protein